MFEAAILGAVFGGMVVGGMWVGSVLRRRSEEQEADFREYAERLTEDIRSRKVGANERV